MNPARIVIALEAGDTFWPEGDALARKHFDEVEGELAKVRPYEPAVAVLRHLNQQGVFRIVTARIDGRLVGYYTWTIMQDVESARLLVAYQGAWYVEPGYPRAAFQLYDFSIKLLKEMGVHGLYPHHRVLGRGAQLGKFFRRHGAVPTKQEYYLDLKGI